MAIGKSEENIAVNNLTIKFGKFTIVENGKQIDNYDENLVRKLKDKGLVPKSINIDVDTQYSSDDDDNMGFVFSTNIPDSSSDDEETLEKKKVDSDETTSEDDIDVDDI